MNPPTQLDRIEALMRQLIAQTAPKMPGEDEKVFRDPPAKYWEGESYAGNKMSECPADYLRALAKYKSACAFMNRKEADPAKAQYADRDDKTAATAKEWAAYQEASGGEVHTPVPKPAPKKTAPPVSNDADGDDVPF